MKRIIMTLPAVITSGIVALPILTCPACWPLYAGLFSALGLGFFDYTSFLLPVTVVLLLVSLLPLTWKVGRRRSYRPLAIGFIGAILILYGKFWLGNQLLYYIGVGILLVASIWNIWPRRGRVNCHHCISGSI